MLADLVHKIKLVNASQDLNSVPRGPTVRNTSPTLSSSYSPIHFVDIIKSQCDPPSRVEIKKFYFFRNAH